VYERGTFMDMTPASVAPLRSVDQIRHSLKTSGLPEIPK
jgi:hypothetical protein